MNDTDKEALKAAAWSVIIFAAFCIGIWAISQSNIQITP